MNKDEVLGVVKQWITLDDEIKQLQKVIKEKRKEKKAYTENLVEVMKSNDIQCFDISDGKLMYTQNKVKSALSKKHLIKSLTEWFKDDPSKIGDLTKHILNSREEKIKENIKRKIKK